MVKRELKRRKNYGRLAVHHGCGLWCCGTFLGCQCCERASKIDIPKGLENAQYDNRGLAVSDMHLNIASEKGKLSLDDEETPSTEPVGNDHDIAKRAGSSSTSSSGRDKDDSTEMRQKSGITGDEIIEDDGENTRL